MVFSRDFWRSLPKVPFLVSAMGIFSLFGFRLAKNGFCGGWLLRL